ncbi:mitochondrial coenzyme A diphosphatase NUDT8 isoform X1 [Tympanuchus pallidicinctus]|uniref:mitochondrial coenzyme A diphosphatase NUDT8 isoform X1 n=1 Tax=Tympanuchus pallidicinctus TaxID=109042 RepID=UPI002286E880|nr:mitochondrial coenzyme A diphosphatase NUDT8 isoform X1 [Tympanuchus pallidicinctus]
MRVGSWARGVTHRVTLCGGTERRCRRLLAEGAAGGGAEAGAAVLVPLCSVRGRPALLYTLRCSRLRGPYGGDVSFPGGKREAADGGAEGTALREAREELGLNLREERVWGRLRELPDRNGDEDNAGTWGQCGNIRKNTEMAKERGDGRGTWDVSVLESVLMLSSGLAMHGMLVVPVVANLGPLEDLTLSPNPDEVAEVFTLPLEHLLQEENQGYTHFRTAGRYGYTLPVFLNGPHRIWGLTAIITELTLELLAPNLYCRKTHVPGHGITAPQKRA